MIRQQTAKNNRENDGTRNAKSKKMYSKRDKIDFAMYTKR